MGHKNRTILVRAADDQAKPGEVQFSMAGFGVSGDRIICKKDDPNHPMKDQDHHKIIFELVDESTFGLRFEDENNVMWVGPKGQLNGCPASGSKQDNVVKAKHVSSDGEQLTVHNFNKKVDEGEYKFALNFVDANNKTHCYDPIWDERNGGFQMVNRVLSPGTLGAAIAAIAVIGAVAMTWFNR